MVMIRDAFASLPRPAENSIKDDEEEKKEEVELIYFRDWIST